MTPPPASPPNPRSGLNRRLHTPAARARSVRSLRALTTLGIIGVIALTGAYCALAYVVTSSQEASQAHTRAQFLSESQARLAVQAADLQTLHKEEAALRTAAATANARARAAREVQQQAASIVTASIAQPIQRTQTTLRASTPPPRSPATQPPGDGGGDSFSGGTGD